MLAIAPLVFPPHPPSGLLPCPPLLRPAQGYWGTAGINGLNIDSNIPGAVLENVTAKSVTLGDAVNEEVLLLKVWAGSNGGGCAGRDAAQDVGHTRRVRVWREM
eukprot:88473-Chlamydomonas_euryale.AAC.1